MSNAMEMVNVGQLSEQLGEAVKVYEKSFETAGSDQIVMIRTGAEKKLLVKGGGELYQALNGEFVQGDLKLAPLTHENRLVLNRFFDYTVPKAFGPNVATIGLGDRLGLASPGHIQTIRDRGVYPILSQQSIRELNLTGRKYEDVLDAASFAVFQEGYKDGFGADGDHLKVESDIQMALDLGLTMITLDCSDFIDNSIESLSDAEVEAKYAEQDEALRAELEKIYLDQSFQVEGQSIHFSRGDLMKNVLIYGKAIGFMKHVYSAYIQKAKHDIDFEISIDETMTPTLPSSHFFVANELYRCGITIYSMAPRFCGEFQKGIDYIGDVQQFEQEMIVHAAIADHFGYKLSIHSGSDKFSVFEIIGRHTNGRFHVKTAGTNWLEAVRTVAKVNPDLYRRMHAFALSRVDEALQYYHITADFNQIKPLDQVSDADLPEYMNEDNARQLIHITYGILLTAKDEHGETLFKDEFYRTLNEQEEAYEQSLIQHIGKHLDLLGKPVK